MKTPLPPADPHAKNWHYAALKEEIAINWTTDWELYAENHWDLLRSIDEWLLATKDDPRVSYEDFCAQADRMRQLYVPF